MGRQGATLGQAIAVFALIVFIVAVLVSAALCGDTGTGWWARGGQGAQEQQAEIAARSTHVSFQVLSDIQDHSPFPPAYGYLFIILVLTASIRLLTLPLTVRAARLDEDDVLRDPALLSLGAELTADLIFAVWGLVALGNYIPRMRLDGARLLWVADVTRFNFMFFLAWAVPTVLAGYVWVWLKAAGRGGSREGLGCGALGAVAVLAGAAAGHDWPAYVFIFVPALVVSSLVLRAGIRLIVIVVERRQRRR
jgi:hypothetical protein